MVNEKVKIRDKYRILKRLLVIIGVIIVIGVILLGVFFLGWFSGGDRIVLENPLEGIVLANADAQGQVNYDAVISEGVMEFNADYINYILFAMGVQNLHKSYVGYGNPVVEFVIDDEIWKSELKNNKLHTDLGEAEDEDLRVIMSKEEAVKALLSPDIIQFMKDSVYKGNTRIEMRAGMIELGSKGYLGMYKELTGKELEE